MCKGHEKISLLESTYNKSLPWVGLYGAEKHCSTFYCDNTFSSPLNKPQAEALLHWTGSVLSHEEVTIDSDQIRWPPAPPAPLSKGLVLALTCTGDGCLQNLPDPIFP